MRLLKAHLVLALVPVWHCAAAAGAGGVTIVEREGPYRVTTDVYTARIDERGCLQSLVVCGTEFLCPATRYTWRGQEVVWPGTACGMSLGGGRPFRLHAPARVKAHTATSIVVEAEGWSLTYTFGPDTIDFRFQGLLPAEVQRLGQLCLNLSPQIERVCEPRKHGEIPWPEVRGGYGGHIAVLDAKGCGLVGQRARLHPRVRKQYPQLLTFWLHYHAHKPVDVTHRVRILSKPDLTHAVRMSVTSPNPDHFFPGVLEVTFPVQVEALYGLSCKGKLRFDGQPYVWKKPPVRAEADLSLSPTTPKQTVDLTIRVPKRGHYTGKLQVIDGDAVVAEKIIGFVTSPEKLAPPPVPEDFDAFWDHTLAELAKTPLDMELTEFPKMATPAGRLYKVKFRSWAGRWAWAWLHVPKKTEKVIGTVACPPVSVYHPGPARPALGSLTIKAAVHGGDVEFRKPKVDFDYMNTGITSRETFMLRYSYCCLARCYDILHDHPLCNGTIHAGGGSQGGGLSLVLAGLRPVKKVTAASIALCRIDWTILGHTRWGPRLPKGEDPQRIAKIVSYYDPARFMHRVDPGCTVRLVFGLFDFCAPAEALFTAVNGLPPSVRREIYADPYGSHHTSTGEAMKRFYGNEPPIKIPRWQGSKKDNKLVR